MKIKLFVLVLLASSSSFAIDSSKCSTMLNNGWYKKYKWAGVGEANSKAVTAETKKSGAIPATFNMGTENTTVTLDPKYSTNVSVSNTQVTSSWGPCSLLAMKQRNLQREMYVQQNFDQIKKDIANGEGEHMKTLAWYALCDDNASQQYFQTLQKGFEQLNAAPQSGFVGQMDALVEQNTSLQGKCLNLTKL